MRRLGRVAAIATAVAFAVVAGLPLGVRLLGLGPDPAALPRVGRAVPVAGGFTLAVAEAGAGFPVVLVHGLPQTLHDWQAISERLAAHGHRVIRYDRRGYGGSDRADPDDPASYTYASSANDLGALLDALALERATLVGWSYGGGVVQLFAEAHPERVTQLVLLGSVGPSLAPAEDPLSRLTRSPVGLPAIRWAGAVTPIARAFFAAEAAKAFSGAEHVPPGWIERSLVALLLPGTLAAWIQENQRQDPVVFRPEAIATPSLVLHGDDDRLVPIEVGEDLARRLPNARLVRFPEGSHMLPLTHSGETAIAIHEFVVEGRRAAASH